VLCLLFVLALPSTREVGHAMPDVRGKAVTVLVAKLMELLSKSSG